MILYSFESRVMMYVPYIFRITRGASLLVGVVRSCKKLNVKDFKNVENRKNCIASFTIEIIIESLYLWIQMSRRLAIQQLEL